MGKWPTPYTCKFMEPGIISYQDSGAGIAYLTKETIDRLCTTAVGKPVVVRHQHVTPDNIDKVAVGYITRVYFNPADAWFYVEFLITSDEVEPIEREDGSIVFKAPDGEILDGISGAYDVTNTADGGVWHDIQFDAEILDGSFTHLALVINPRYEQTNKIRPFVPSMVVNGKMPKPMKNAKKYNLYSPVFDMTKDGVELEGDHKDGDKVEWKGFSWIVKNSKHDEMYAKEKAEHPEMSDDEIERIVADHLSKENATSAELMRIVQGELPGHESAAKELKRLGILLPKSYEEKHGKENSKGDSIMKNIFKIFRKVANGKPEGEEAKDKVVSINGKDVPLQELINSYMEDQEEEKKKKEAENAKKNAAADDDEVEVDGKKVKVADLKNSYAAKMAKKNEKESAEEKAAEEKKAKEESEAKENEKKNAEDKEAKEKDEKQNAISRQEAEDLFEQYAEGKPDAWHDDGDNFTPQKISAWLKQRNMTQSDINATIGHWRNLLAGNSKKNSKANGDKFFNEIENAGKGGAIQDDGGAGPRTRAERAEIGKQRYGSKNK